MSSSNADCEKTTQYFAVVSARDFLFEYMWSSMGSYVLLPMLRLAEKRARRFRNVTRNFACRDRLCYS